MEEGWKSAYAGANGIRLHYWRTGGSGPRVVLAHGFSDNGRCWRRFAGAVEDEFDLVMYDARGHGLSDAPESGYSSVDHAADIAGLVRVLGLGTPAVMGHSMGAAAAAQVGAEYPGIAGCLVLEDPPWRDTSPEERRGGRMRDGRQGIVDQKAKSIEEIAAQGRASSPSWDEAEFEAWAEAKKQMSLNPFDRQTGLDLSQWRDIVKRIICPVLLVTGDPDRGAIVTPETAAEAQGLCPNIRVVRLKGAGHSIRRERFDDFVQAVRVFLRENR